LKTAGLDAGETRRRSAFVADHMGTGLDDDLVARPGVQADGELVRHRAGGHEERGFLAEQPCRHLLQTIDGRVFAEDVVADLGRRHRLAHGGRGLRHRIAAQVDHVVRK